MKDRRKINVIAKEILDIKQRNIKAKAKTYTKHKLSSFRIKVNTKLKSKKTINRCNLLNVGSYVRLVLADVTQSKFTKGYKQQNTQEIFKIHSIKKETLPITYRLKDLSGEIIKGSFYKHELVETAKPEFFLINKILKSKSVNNIKYYFVSWSGYDASFNSWIKSSSIYNFEKNK